MEWVVAGAAPKRVSRKEKSEIRTSFDTLYILNQLKAHDFSDSDFNQIINILKERNYIKSAIRVETKAARDAMDYQRPSPLETFWIS